MSKAESNPSTNACPRATLVLEHIQGVSPRAPIKAWSNLYACRHGAVGIAEVAGMLKVSKQRADQLAAKRGSGARSCIDRREGLGEVGRGSVDARSREAQVNTARLCHENEEAAPRSRATADHDRASKFWRSRSRLASCLHRLSLARSLATRLDGQPDLGRLLGRCRLYSPRPPPDVDSRS